MLDTYNYAYTPKDVDNAFLALEDHVFANKRRDIGEYDNPAPKLLIVAGIQGSGKTYLLEKTLISSGRYNHYIRLYDPTFREKHPHYAQMLKHGVLHAYEHTEHFIWALCGKIFEHAFQNNYNIIMETALDSIDFASFPRIAAEKGYQFEVHLLSCKKEFAHFSTIQRLLKSLESGELERYVSMTKIEESMGNAQSILTAFEDACTMAPGSQITLYERGFGAKDRKEVCRALCTQATNLIPQPVVAHNGVVMHPDENPVRIERTTSSNQPCAYNTYAAIVNASMTTQIEKGEALKACHIALRYPSTIAEQVPYVIHNDLYNYILKYLVR